MTQHKLIIAEKPSLGRTIASALGAYKKYDGYIEGSGYIVSWCMGHLYELASPESYFPELKEKTKVPWKDLPLPFYPDNWDFQYVPMKDQGKRKQIKLLRALMNREDVDTIYSAGDADREGEVIVRLVIGPNLNSSKKILRLWLPSLTVDAINDAVTEAKEESYYDDLYEAGLTRAAVDWLMGIELTRYASVKVGRLCRIGRCVCPIVMKIVERDEEIAGFIPEKYVALVWKYGDKDTGIELTSKKKFKPDEAEAIKEALERLNCAPARVIDVKKKDAVQKAQKLFSMSDLQSYMCRKDKSLTPSNVLDTVQALYEKGYVTYPRTGSNYLTKAESVNIKKILNLFSKECVYGLSVKEGNTDIYDDSRVESHSALTPTGKIPKDLSVIEEEVYDAIRNRFFAVFSEEECIVSKSEAVIKCGDEEFVVKGSTLMQKGWRKFEEPQKKDKELPKLRQGDILKPDFKALDKETAPPKRYTVESLNAWMKSPMRGEERSDEYSDSEWKDILQEATICTEATRATIIDKCVKSQYIQLDHGVYKALPEGYHLRDVMNSLGIDLSPSRTIELSRNIHAVSDGKKQREDVLVETKEMLDEIFRKDGEIKSSYEQSTKKELIGICPRCGKKVYELPRSYSCEDRDCGFTIWKNNNFLENMNKKVTKSLVKTILKDGKVYIKGFHSKSKDKLFDAWLVMEDTGKYVNFKLDFDRRS